MQVLKGHPGQVRSLSFSVDGMKLASAAGHGKSVSLWHLDQGGRRSFLSGHVARVKRVLFAPRGSLLASLDAWGALLLWDADTGRRRASVPSYIANPDCLAFTPDGSGIIEGQMMWPRYELRRLDVATGELVPSATVTGPVSGYGLPALAHAPLRDVVAVALTNRIVQVWDLAAKERRHELPHRETIHALAYSPDGRSLAVASGLTINVWEAETYQEQTVLKGHKRIVTDVAFLPGGRLLASASTDQQVKLWDVDSGREHAAFDWEIGPVLALAVAPDGMRAACGGQGGGIVVWDLDV